MGDAEHSAGDTACDLDLPDLVPVLDPENISIDAANGQRAHNLVLE